MPKYYSTNRNGVIHHALYPFTKEESIELGLVWYTDLDSPCERHQPTSRYVHDDKCKGCLVETVNYMNTTLEDDSTFYLPKACKGGSHLVRKNASGGNNCITCSDARKDARDEGSPTYTSVKGCPKCFTFERITSNGRCYKCAMTSPRQVAVMAGETTYIPDDNCDQCGYKAPRRVSNSSCTGCEKSSVAEQSPRQKAVAAGELWYTPTDPCVTCGEVSPRRVNNGSCKSCERKRKVTDGINLPADIILTRDMAIIAGIKYYRTGKFCHNGHNGFRYTSTGQCVDCMRERT